MDYSDPNQAEWALQNPTTPGEALAAIAQAHPGLRDRVVTHPNAYPQLVAWIAAQSTSAASASVAPQSGPGQYGPAQPYGAPQPPYGMAQQYQGQPAGPGQPYYGPGGYPAGQPKKKTGLVLGLVGGGAVAVVAVVAVLGIFVFHWFGGGSSGPTLTKSQVEAFLDGDFMQELTDGTAADDYSYQHFSLTDAEFENLPEGCGKLVSLMRDGDSWSSWSASVDMTRFVKSVSPDAAIAAADGCEEMSVVEDRDKLSINKQSGGWWVKDDSDGSVTFVYGNVWLALSDPAVDSDDAIKNLFEDFVAAIDAAAK